VLIRELDSAGLVRISTTMGPDGAIATEIRFFPEATKYVVRFFH
jgi:hypothetical protein